MDLYVYQLRQDGERGTGPDGLVSSCAMCACLRVELVSSVFIIVPQMGYIKQPQICSMLLFDYLFLYKYFIERKKKKLRRAS
jgi:hypothetical protein